MSDEPKMTGIDKKIFNATRTLTSLLNDACNHWNYLCPYLEKLAGVADDALRGYQKDYPEQVAELIDYRRKRGSHGNAAAMRDALNDIVGIANIALNVNCVENSNNSELWNIIDKAKAAISAPARNCDRFSDETDAQIAFLNEVWLISVTKETALERDRFENWTDEMKSRYANWLLAPAAERKGEVA